MKQSMPRGTEKVIKYLDTDYSVGLAKKMERFRTNPSLGYRTAGSDAEIKTGKMLAEEMKAIGLKNVRRDRISLDSWEFKKAVLVYTDKNSHKHRCELGGYQTAFDTKGPAQFGIVYVGKGTKAEYEGLDVKDKLVIVDINQRDEWWINYPVYEAYLHGAAAALVVQQYGYGEVDERALNAQDIAGPAYAPAFSLSKRDASKIKPALKKNPGMMVTFDALSNVRRDKKSYNILGEIPGRDKEGLILLSAHYDSYFSGFQDDNAAIGMLLGLAKAFIKSGLKPNHTIIFMALCAEEWGVEDSKYDWSTGAYEEVFTVHPDWKGRVIADINFELPAHAHDRKDAIRSTYEYVDFLKKFASGIDVPEKIYPKGLKVKCPIETWSDDFSFSIGGIPSVVNDFSSGDFMETHYHSQFDNEDYYEEDVYRFHHELYASLLMKFDSLLIPPMDFTLLFDRLMKSLDEELCMKADADASTFKTAVFSVRQIAEELYEKTVRINQLYSGFIEDDDQTRARAMRKTYRNCSNAILEAFLKAQSAFVRLNWNDSVVFPHEGVCDNIKAIRKAIAALKNGDAIKALEKIYSIDNNRYAFLFSEKVFLHFTDTALRQPADRLKWGAGRIIRHTNLFKSVERLKKLGLLQFGSGRKLDKTQLKSELKYYKDIEQRHLKYLKEDMEYMSRAIIKIRGLLGKALGETD